jgi:hypothetical protein
VHGRTRVRPYKNKIPIPESASGARGEKQSRLKEIRAHMQTIETSPRLTKNKSMVYKYLTLHTYPKEDGCYDSRPLF